MNVIEWDPQLFLDMLATPKTGRYAPPEHKQARVNVYKNNLDVFSQWGYVASTGKEIQFPEKQGLLDATKVYSKEFDVNGIASRKGDTVISIQENGSIEAGERMIQRGLNPAILNFADAYEACGMYNQGSPAQEESLCRVSTLSPSLYQYYNKLWARKSFVDFRGASAYPMDLCFGGIYSPVVVFRDGSDKGYPFKEEPFSTAIISVAALNLRKPNPRKGNTTNHEYAGEGDQTLTPEGIKVMLHKIRTIYRIALSNGHDSIVLGAWGCGVFRHDPKQIAQMFLQVLHEEEFLNKFSEVVFAVIGKDNYASQSAAIREAPLQKPIDTKPRKSKYVTNLTLDQVEENRRKIIDLLQNTKREGIDAVVKYLDEHQFFTGAAARTLHDSMYGGLAFHSLRVLEEAKKAWDHSTTEQKAAAPSESLIIACLLHDLCKCGTHPCEYGGRPITVEFDQVPCRPGEEPQLVKYNRGYHGLKSIDILRCIGFNLTEAESLAIRWHMFRYTDKINLLPGEKVEDYRTYAEKHPLVALTMLGDKNAADLSSCEEPQMHTIEELFTFFDQEPEKRTTMEPKRLTEANSCNIAPGRQFKGLIFDIDYFDDKSDADLQSLKMHIEETGVRVAIVTLQNKTEWSPWVKKAPIRIDHAVGGGDIKLSRFSFCRKPNPKPMQVAMAWLDCDPADVLSVCTKDIDIEASNAAGIATIVNPDVDRLLPYLAQGTAPIDYSIDKNFKVPTRGIMGAICGDIIGSTYENNSRRTKNYDFELFTKHSKFSDDTILSLAIAEWLMGERSEENLVHQYVCFANRYPSAYWGSSFKGWLSSTDHAKRVASSNGSAMRVSPIAYVATSLEECQDLARQTAELTHNSEEGIRGAQAVADATYLALHGKSKEEIRKHIETAYGYNLGRTLDEMRDSYDLKVTFSCACDKCAEEAITCWLLANSYEEAIRNSVSLGGDADTIAAMAGGIAAATPGFEIPEDIAIKCYSILKDSLKKNQLKSVLFRWEKYLSTRK